MSYDVLIIGGGPAGMAAAIAAKKGNNKVLLIEKNQKLGLKMLISGGGRCNFTNVNPIDEFIKNVPGNGKFLHSAFNSYSNTEFINFVEKDLNISTIVEDEGRVFPTSSKSVTLVESIEKYISNLGVNVIYGSKVVKILTEELKVTGVMTEGNQVINGKTIVLTTGGLSYPQTGSNGEGHSIVKKLGHHVTELFPSLVPLICNDLVIINKDLQGLSLKDIELYLFDTDNKCIKKESGDMIFTHFGISGPAVLRLSRYVSILHKNKGKVSLKVLIDLLPKENEESLSDIINNLIKTFPKKNIDNGLKDLLPEKLLKYIIKINNIESKKMNELTTKEIKSIINYIKKLSLSITDTKPIEEAMVTGGGIDTKEVNPKTLGSKLIEGLFFAGEILDIDANTGGYNIQLAFSTGHVAGISAGEYSMYN